MPYLVELPDGRRVEFPDSVSREEAANIIRTQLLTPAAEVPETTALGEVKETFKGIAPGAVGLLESAITGAAAILPEEAERGVRRETAEFFRPVREALAPEAGYEESTGRKFGEALGSTAPFFALGPLGVAGRAAGFALGAGAGAGEARVRAEREGGEEERGLATIGGAAVGATEMFPVFGFIQRLGKPFQNEAFEYIRRAALTGGAEGAQEAAAGIAQNLIAKGLYKPEQGLLEGAGEQAGYGFGVGALVQGLTDLALGRRPGSITETGAAPPEEAPVTPAVTPERQEPTTELSPEELARRYAEEDEALRREYEVERLREAEEAERLAPEDREGVELAPRRLEEVAVEEETPSEPVLAEPAESVDVGAVGRGDVVPPQRPAPAGPAIEGLEPERLGGPSDVSVTPDAGEVGVEPALNLRSKAIEFVQQTGKGSAVALQKALGIKLSEAKALREDLINSGEVVQKGKTYALPEAAPAPEPEMAPPVPTPALPERQVKKAAEAIVSRRIQPSLALEETGGVAPEAPVSVKPLGRRELLQEAKELYDAGKVSTRVYRSVLEDLSSIPIGGLKQRDLAKLRNKLRASQQRVEAAQAAPVEQVDIQPSVSVDEELAQFYARREAEDVRQRRQRGEREIGLRLQRGMEGTAPKGLPVEDVSKAVKSTTSGWTNAPKIEVIEDVAQAPEALRGSVDATARGFYDPSSRTVYVVAKNADSEAGVKSTVYHESLGHFGLQEQFGKRLDEIASDIYKTNSAMRKAADTWLERNPDAYEDLSPDIRRARAVEEVIAEKSEAGPIKEAGIRAAFNRLAAFIRRAARAMGLKVDYSNNDVRNIMRLAHGRVGTKPSSNSSYSAGVRYQKKQFEAQMEGVQDFVNNLPNATNRTVEDFLNSMSNVPDAVQRGVLGFMSLFQQAQVFKDTLPSLSILDKVAGMRASDLQGRRETISKDLNRWYKVVNKYKKELPEFYRVANETTRLQIDVKDPKFAQNQVYKDFYKLPPELQETYFQLLNRYKQASEEFKDYLVRNLSKDTAKKFLAEYEKKELKIYLPLFRHGQYWLRYNDKAGEMVVEAFETERERAAAMRQVRADGATGITPFTRARQLSTKTVPPTGFLGEIVEELTKQGAPQEMLDSIYEAYLDTLPADSLRQRFRAEAREGILGFEKDVFQVYANMASKMANQLTNMKYARDIDGIFRKIKQEEAENADGRVLINNAVNNVESMLRYIQNPQNGSIADKASYFSYMWFIAGNPSSALINLTQLPLVVYPLLGGKYGFGEAVSAMKNAISTYNKGGRDNNSDFMPDFTFGATATGELKDLYDTAVSRSVIRRSTGYEITEAKKVSAEDYTGMRARIEHALGWMFQNSERFNREVTLLAAYNLARKKMSHKEAIEEAISVVNDAHGAALAETGPRFFQTDIGKVMFIFKRFAQAMIYLQARLFHTAFKSASPKERSIALGQLLGIYGAAYGVAGVQGMPLYGLGSSLASLIMGFFDQDEPFDPDEKVREAVGDLGYKGPLNKLLMADVASRTGFNGLLWRDDPKRMAEIGPILYGLEQALGPSYSLLTGFGRGITLIKEGEYQRAMEAFPPSPVRNALKAMRFTEEGIRTKDGIKIVDDPSAYNVVMQAAGFTPSELAESRARAGAMKQAETKINERRASLLDRLDAARVNGDSDGVRDALRAIANFNQANPSWAISANTIARSYRERRRREQFVVDGVYLPRKAYLELQREYGS